MLLQQLSPAKLNILCKIYSDSPTKKSWFLKIRRNKLIFTGFNHYFGFYSLKFCSKGCVRDHQAYLVSLTQIRSQNLVSEDRYGT